MSSAEALARALADKVLGPGQVDNGELPDASRALLAAFDLAGLGRAERALMCALDEFAFQRGWNPDLHPRWTPGTAGGKGGQFRPLAERILGALTEWQAKGGSKSGVDPFKGFTDAQLRKVAKARGLYVGDPKTGRPKLRRDAGRDDVAKGLLRDLRSKEGARRRPAGVDRKSWDTLRSLASGQRAEIAPAEVDALMHAIAVVKPPPFNLAHLQVTGVGNGNLFRRHLRNRPRGTMPQLPTGHGEEGAASGGRTMADFEAYLRERGVKFSYGTMDPRELVASQSELSGPKVAKLYGFMAGGWKPGGVMIIARSGDEWAVVDGHHRWAAAAARSISGDDTLDVDVLMLLVDIDDVLGTPEHPDGVVMDFASFEGLGADRES